MDVFDSTSPNIENVANYRGRRQTHLTTARKRNDTVGAKFIAAFDDRNKRHIGRMSLRVGDGPIVSRFAITEVSDLALTIHDALDGIGDSTDGFCADHKI